ncbi:MAG TPA: hypothetical protein VH206_09720 [Xanthobacteraceae bacterium]|jgi:hypothetical protein|nr:hypothetical protein [Xanthobacteraceae bacterium]
MAIPPELARTVSLATGVPLPTIVDIDRRLAQAGLRTKGGRGLYAAQMTALDAARLLTGVLASPQANVAAGAVERYALTAPDRPRSSERLFAGAKLEDLAALSDRTGFVDALAALITSAGTGSLAALIAKGDSTPVIEVFAFTRAVRGRIRIAGLPNGCTASVEYGPTPRTRAKSPKRGGSIASQESGDLEQSRRITERTILPIAELLIKDTLNERS